jgi:hypothetical protein
MPASAVLTSIVQKALAYILPHRVRAIQPHCISVSDLNGATAPYAIDAQNLAGDFI